MFLGAFDNDALSNCTESKTKACEWRKVKREMCLVLLVKG